MRGDAVIHFVCGSRRVNIRLGVLLLIPKSPQYTEHDEIGHATSKVSVQKAFRKFSLNL